jgi:hypothetical protein
VPDENQSSDAPTVVGTFCNKWAAGLVSLNRRRHRSGPRGKSLQEAPQRYCIKFRPNRPRERLSIPANGLGEFYATMDVQDPSLFTLLEERQFFYNWHRPHNALGGKSRGTLL